jgi:hypothetical protein
MERDAAHRAGYIQALRNVAVGAEYWRTTHERAGLFSAADRYHAMVHRAIHALADLGEEDAKRMVGGVE